MPRRRGLQDALFGLVGEVRDAIRKDRRPAPKLPESAAGPSRGRGGPGQEVSPGEALENGFEWHRDAGRG